MPAQTTFETASAVLGLTSDTLLPRPETPFWEVPVTLPSEATLT